MSKKEKRLFFKWPQVGSSPVHNQSGFFLIEIMVALFVLVLILSTVIPIWMHIHTETKAKHLQSAAIDVAQNEIEKFYYGDGDDLETMQAPREIVYHQETFTVEWKPYATQLCGACEEWSVIVSWETPSKSRENIILTVYRVGENTY